MSLPLLSIQKSFPDAFAPDSEEQISQLETLFKDGGFTPKGLSKIIEIADGLNKGDYGYMAIKDSLAYSEGTAGGGVANEFDKTSNGNYILYAKTTDEQGNTAWMAITSLDQAISSSVELYLHHQKHVYNDDPAGDGLSDYDFVHVYDLARLSKAGIAKRFDKQGTAMGVAAMLYHLCCKEKLIMERHMCDIEVVNDEQEQMNRIMQLLSQVQNTLAAEDKGKTNPDDKAKRQLPAEIVAFFVSRNLLETASTSGYLDKATLELMRSWIKDKTSSEGPLPDYWDDEINTTHAALMKKFTDKMTEKNMKFDSDQVAIWVDTLRIYSDRVSSDNSTRTTQMQSALQQSQQDLNVATNLLKSIFKQYGEGINNVR